MNRMIKADMQGIDFWVLNTDAQASQAGAEGYEGAAALCGVCGLMEIL